MLESTSHIFLVSSRIRDLSGLTVPISSPIYRLSEPAMSTVTLNSDNFGPMIDDNEIVIIDVGAEWCAPCKAFEPTFEAASTHNPDVLFAKMNTEEEHALAAYFSIRSVPSVMVFRDQVLLYNEPGAMDEAAIEQLLNYIKGLDMAMVRQEVAAATENVLYN